MSPAFLSPGILSAPRATIRRTEFQTKVTGCLEFAARVSTSPSRSRKFAAHSAQLPSRSRPCSGSIVGTASGGPGVKAAPRSSASPASRRPEPSSARCAPRSAEPTIDAVGLRVVAWDTQGLQVVGIEPQLGMVVHTQDVVDHDAASLLSPFGTRSAPWFAGEHECAQLLPIPIISASRPARAWMERCVEPAPDGQGDGGAMVMGRPVSWWSCVGLCHSSFIPAGRAEAAPRQ